MKKPGYEAERGPVRLCLCFLIKGTNHSKCLSPLQEPGEGSGKLPMYLISMGKHKLKGVTRPIEISELSCPSTASRTFSRIKASKSLQNFDLGPRRASDYGRNYRGSDQSSRGASIHGKIEASTASFTMGASSSLQALVSLAGRRPSVTFFDNPQSPDFPSMPSFKALGSTGRRNTMSMHTESPSDSKNSESSGKSQPGLKLRDRRGSL